MKSTNVTRIMNLVDQSERFKRQGHVGGVLWFTGLPASGKKTLAHLLETRLFNLGYQVIAFDSVWLRKGLTSDLKFCRLDRKENIRRAGELAALLSGSGLIVITAFISPYVEDRAVAREMNNNFHEIYLDVPIEICEARDQRNRYKRAHLGELTNFTGVSAPYEKPLNPNIVLEGSVLTKHECVDYLVDYVNHNFKSA
ncbi:MAG: adenylyl-sulfate kinase [Magnetovibrio sp.]|nr:adenylyl-sulfate kinase [Magnetovibrio sp.]